MPKHKHHHHSSNHPPDPSYPKVIIIPGNGTGCIYSNFYFTLRDSLQLHNISVVAKDMPDGDTARESIWVPFIERMGVDGSVVVGHSSGALAGLRIAERNKLKALVLVSLALDDLGDDNEKASGYFDRPFEWKKVRENTEKVVLFASDDDPFIPLEMQREGGELLRRAGKEERGFEYVELKGRSHFFDEQQEEILECVLKIVKGED